jgi:maltose alpha-D-glucosyltransferase/alpha-amylase
MHLALAGASYPLSFVPEDFSLHYQRSLYSSMQSLVREAFQAMQRNLSRLTPDVQEEAIALLKERDRILEMLKRIYSNKLDVTKIRIHGNYHLGQVLLTGKDVAIKDFSGDPYRTLSERRLKRSPLRDVAAMISSYYYTAYEGLRDTPELLPFASLWAYHQSGFFVQAYLETVPHASFIPKHTAALQMMLQTYLLQRAMHNLADDMNNRPEWATVSLNIIKMVLGEV